MKLSKIERSTIILIALTFFVSLVSYPFLPDFLASHWNLSGTADGFSPKPLTLFAMPLITVVIFLFVLTLPKTAVKPRSPMHEYYDLFVLIVIAFLALIQTLTILWNLGVRLHLAQFLAVVIAVLLFYLAELARKKSINPVSLEKITVYLRVAAVVALSGVFLKTLSLVLATCIVAVAFQMIRENGKTTKPKK